jgi:SAM-dependent methyltransferase
VSDVRAEQIDAWRAAAPGWDRQRALFWEASRNLSERMIELLELEPGDRVIEVAAGPGDTGFLAAGLVGPSGSLLSTDAAPEMVDTARRRAEELGLTNVEFAVTDAAELSLEPNSFDAAICRFGVMLVPNCARAVAEVARVVRPGGRAVYGVWAEPARNPWMTAPGRAALSLGYLEPPDPDAPGPFRLAAPGALRTLAEASGLERLHEEEVKITWHARSLEEWWASTLDLSRTLAMLVGRLSADELEAVREGALELLREYVGSDGSMHVPGVARVLLGRRTVA